MTETWGNGHYSCYGCSEQDKPRGERTRCSTCFTYTPLMQGYYKNWIKEDKKQTNADRIRSMTDEELAELLNTKTCHKCEYNYRPCMSVECVDGVLEWLQKECEV